MCSRGAAGKCVSSPGHSQEAAGGLREREDIKERLQEMDEGGLKST